MSPLGELTVRWTGAEEGEVEIHDEFDGAPADETPEDQAPADEAPAEPEDRDDEDTQ
jgi:segregation and condensation protein A